MSFSSGYLEPGRVPASFKAMYAGRRTGVLRFRRDGTSCGVSFIGGHVSHVEAGRGQLRLAERMAARGLLSRDDRKRGTERALRDGRRVGETLVGLGLIDQEALRHAMVLHAKEIVAELLAWTEGNITFEPRDRVGGRYEQPLALSTAQLVVDASRVITDHDVFGASLDRDLPIAIAKQPLLRMQRLRWSPADRFVLDCVSGGRRSIAEVVRDVPLPATEAERIVSTLLWIGVLEPARAEIERPPFEREIPSKAEVLEFHAELGAKDHFRVLGLAKGATETEVAQAYARVASRFHPDAQHDVELEDLGEELEAIFERAEEAFEALTVRTRESAAAEPAILFETPTLELPALEVDAAEAHMQHAQSRIDAGAYFEGVALLRELLIRSLDPATRSKARRQLALAYLDSPNTVGRARAELERVVAESPRDVEALVLLARANVRLGDEQAARSSLQQALQLDPDHAGARSALAAIGAVEG